VRHAVPIMTRRRPYCRFARVVVDWGLRRTRSWDARWCRPRVGGNRFAVAAKLGSYSAHTRAVAAAGADTARTERYGGRVGGRIGGRRGGGNAITGLLFRVRGGRSGGEGGGDDSWYACWRKLPKRPKTQTAAESGLSADLGTLPRACFPKLSSLEGSVIWRSKTPLQPLGHRTDSLGRSHRSLPHLSVFRYP
jgi:hypothetical protein